MKNFIRFLDAEFNADFKNIIFFIFYTLFGGVPPLFRVQLQLTGVNTPINFAISDTHTY